MENQRHIHDDERSLDSDDDEYEYTYVDSDTEQEDTKRGVKRNASPSFALNHDVARTTLPPTTSHLPQRASLCGHCHQEMHAPITACDLIEKWNEVTQDESLGILVMDAKYIIPSMKRHIQEAANLLKVFKSEAAVRLRQSNWSVQAMRDEAVSTATRNTLAAAAISFNELDNSHGDGDDDYNLSDVFREAAARVQEKTQNSVEDAKKPAAIETTGTATASESHNVSGNASLDNVETPSMEMEKCRAEIDSLVASVQRNDEQAICYDNEKRTNVNGKNADEKLPAVEADAMEDSSTEAINDSRERDRCSGTETGSDEGDTKPLAIKEPSTAEVSFDYQEEPAAQENQPEMDDESLRLVENPQAPAAEEAPVEGFCHICLEGHDVSEEKVFMNMSCGHTFCRKCWRDFISHMFDNAVLPDECLQTTCPFRNCELVVTEDQIAQVAPELLPEYENRQLHSFVEASRQSMRWCAGPDCGNRVAVRSRLGLFPRRVNSSVASCDACQTRFCFGCGQEPHGDGYCDAERGSILSETKGPMKNCPKCSVKIEKNGGCNHMTCKCGHHFCWICLADMYDYNHYCGRERDDDEEYRWLRRRARLGTGTNLEYVFDTLKEGLVWDDDEISDLFRQKKKMDRIAHYLARFVAHEQGQRFSEGQCEMLLEGRAVDFAKATDLKSATDTDFLAVANDRLVASRRILKYSYCYAYYLLDEESEGMISQKGLFQNHQERLERFTEQLSNISEHALTYDDRANIVNLIGIVDQCMKTIIEFEEFGATYACPK